MEYEPLGPFSMKQSGTTQAQPFVSMTEGFLFYSRQRGL